MNIVYEHFQSLHQLLKTLDARQNNKVMEEECSSQTSDFDFTLTNNWDEALKLLRHGYTDVLNDIKRGMKEHAKFQVGVKKRNTKTAVHGVAPHVPNALLGLPNAMIHYETAIQKNKTVSLIYVESATASEEAESFVKSGVALLSTVYALELRGYRVNLKSMFFCGKCDDDRAFVTVNLKDYREQLDLHKLCFPIAHPSMFRRIGFKWIETVVGIEEPNWTRGYGQLVSEEEFSELNVLAKNEYILTLNKIQKCNHNVDEIIQYLNLK